MPIGVRLSDETKREIVNRVNKGEDVEGLAKEYNFSVHSYAKWKTKFGKNPSIKRKVSVPKKRANPLKAEIEELKRKVEFWKGSFMELYERNNQG
jgi:transposase-like protein